MVLEIAKQTRRRATPVRPIRVEGNAAYVPLTRGFVAVIDAEDALLVRDWNWHVSNGLGGLFYASRSATISPSVKKNVLLHRLIVGIEDPKIVVEHFDRDTMNCRKKNLRVANQTVNNQNASLSKSNRSGFRGVAFQRFRGGGGRWKAEIAKNGKRIYLGLFQTAEDAADAYDKAAADLYGPSANLNRNRARNPRPETRGPAWVCKSALVSSTPD